MQLQQVWPFTLGMCLLMFTHRYWCNDSILQYDRSAMGSITTIVIFSVLILFISSKYRKRIEYAILSFWGLLDVIESFMAAHFGMGFAPVIFQILQETNGGETSEFVNAFVFSWKTGQIAISFIAVFFLISLFYYVNRRFVKDFIILFKFPLLSFISLMLFSYSLVWQGSRYSNYYALMKLFTADSMKTMEYVLCTHDIFIAYPFMRLLYSVKSLSLMSEENNLIYQRNRKLEVLSDSEHNKSPLMVLFLGESYVKRHSQHYGYELPTSPFTMKEKESDRLFVFNDVVTIRNQTSLVLRSVFSMGQSGKDLLSEKPLFPALLRKGGYESSMLSNQFVNTQSVVPNLMGGSFINDARICSLLFDNKNSVGFSDDVDLLPLFEEIIVQQGRQFVFFNGLGQHVGFYERSPKDRKIFSKDNYTHRLELSDSERQIVADYDNATRYVDSIMYQMMDILREKEAIMVYVSDHGEEVLDETHKLGRKQGLTPDVVRSEYEVPMWIWCSDTYKKIIRKLFQRFVKNSTLRFPLMIYHM